MLLMRHQSDQRKKREDERFFFILHTDKNRNKYMLKDIKSSMWYGRGYHPITLTNTFDFLIRESGIFDKNTHRNWRKS